MSNTYSKLGISIIDANERRAIFERSCELLSINKEKEAEKLKIGRGREGFNVSSDQLIIFCAMNGIHGGFDFRKENKGDNFLMFLPVVPSKGKITIDAPETIKTTLVDIVEKEEEEEEEEEEEVLVVNEEPSASHIDDFHSIEQSGSFTPLPPELTEGKPDDDDSPF